VFQELEKRDEQQILRELEGEQLEEYVYSKEIQGRTVTRLSITGTHEAARNRGNFEVVDWRVDYAPNLVNAVVKIRDLENKCEFLGASSARIDQPFALTLALNKAERNALNKMLPAKWIASMIEEFLDRRKAKLDVKTVPGGVETKPSDEESASAPGPETPASAWHVPVGKESVSGIAQYPITAKSGKTWGLCNVDTTNSEAACVPDGRVKIDSAPVRSFLVGKFLEGLKAKHSIEYELKVENGFLLAVLVRPIVDADSLGELLAATAWTFEKGSETK
jgi:hypothetical protein